MSEPGEDAGVDEQQAIQGRQQTASRSDQEQQKVVKELDKRASSHLSMKVRVYSPFHDYYDGTAFSLTAESATGPFDILPKHHNFISLLEPCDLIIRTVSHGEQKIRISGGLIHVKADSITIFLDV